MTQQTEGQTRDFYAELGILFGADDKIIAASYRKLALKYHPDKNADCKDRFIQIQEAYEVLSNAQKKAQYDSVFQEKIRQEKIEKEMNESRRILRQNLFDSETRQQQKKQNQFNEDERKRQDYLRLLEIAKSGSDDNKEIQELRVSLGISSSDPAIRISFNYNIPFDNEGERNQPIRFNTEYERQTLGRLSNFADLINSTFTQT
ncbi:MAG: hypothetical protein EZS28_027079 [Streblomastix strix]|uniref:J domain-containing protein n=1 Tax=Streblomastix strix TaxID=222440 RepID=A0A5J4V378_9EUKA|nr:MAG: hypothetical protein EZS28_027079 [Streblomastix strix]